MTTRVGLIGLGTVGSAVAARLQDDQSLVSDRAGDDVRLTAVAVRDPHAARIVQIGSDVAITDDADGLINRDDVDLVVELVGGVDLPRSWTKRSLESGRWVVTANKALIAAHGPELFALAARRNAGLLFSAAVGGAVPIVETLTGALRGDRIERIDAILNGTTNFILERMASVAETLDTALSEAQRLGFAEADPRLDISGADTAAKIAITASLAWRGWINVAAIPCRGIEALDATDVERATFLGYVIKLLATAVHDGERIWISVAPTLLPESHPLAASQGSAALIRGDLCGELLLRGAGAGGRRTASAVVSDIVTAVRRRNRTGDDPANDRRNKPDSDPGDKRGSVAAPASGLTTAAELCPSLRLAPAEERETAAYFRLLAGSPDSVDRAEEALNDRGVEIMAIVDDAPHEVIILTEPTAVGILDRAAETIDALPDLGVAARLDLIAESP